MVKLFSNIKPLNFKVTLFFPFKNILYSFLYAVYKTYEFAINKNISSNISLKHASF